MHEPSKALMALQMMCSLGAVCLVVHAGSYDRSYFGASPSEVSLLLVSASHLFLNSFILSTAINSDKIYETPLICLQGVLYFLLLNVVGVLTIMECQRFESQEEKEMGIAGGMAIFAAFTAMFSCCTSYSIIKNFKSL